MLIGHNLHAVIKHAIHDEIGKSIQIDTCAFRADASASDLELQE